MKELKIFHDVAKNPHAYTEKWKKNSGKRAIGYFCSYTPEEFIYAADSLPYRIFSSGENIALADSHLQTYTCSLARGGLEDALSGKLKFLDGTVFPHTCDTIQRLSDIWRLNAGFPLHIDVVLPVKLNTQSAHDYMIDLFIKFKKDIEKGLGVKITDEKLKKSINLYNRIRKALLEIYEIRSEYPGILSGSDVHAIIKASMVMDRDELLNHLTDTVSALKEKKAPDRNSNKKRIMFTGEICSHPNIYSILEESGGMIVWDDLCTGTRYFQGEIDESSEPVKAIADRYFKRITCPAKHSGLTSRGENIVKLAKEREIQGVIFLILKFCDPHCFDYPYMKEYLDNNGIPNMIFEVEEKLPSDGQVRTRFETFVEML